MLLSWGSQKRWALEEEGKPEQGWKVRSMGHHMPSGLECRDLGDDSQR